MAPATDTNSANYVVNVIGGSDFEPIADKQLIFNTDALEMNITIDIIDNVLYESDEEFSINMELISEPFTGLELQRSLRIIIIDDDGKRPTKH